MLSNDRSVSPFCTTLVPFLKSIQHTQNTILSTTKNTRNITNVAVKEFCSSSPVSKSVFTRTTEKMIKGRKQMVTKFYTPLASSVVDCDFHPKD